MEGKVVIIHATANTTLAHYTIMQGGIIPQIGDTILLEGFFYTVRKRTFVLQNNCVRLFVLRETTDV